MHSEQEGKHYNANRLTKTLCMCVGVARLLFVSVGVRRVSSVQNQNCAKTAQPLQWQNWRTKTNYKPWSYKTRYNNSPSIEPA